MVSENLVPFTIGKASDDRLSTPDILLDSPSQLITSTEFKDRHIVAGVWRTGLENLDSCLASRSRKIKEPKTAPLARHFGLMHCK
ncbi:hypothetical protein G6F46_011461 [Rhizopus delemar]|uniref:Uncharacterized protein n=2 Tax=Rhizopus TaxID=4842 RepID=A0A9P6YRZ2_9FUNG|nr:hypothetical protein G6F36_013055 [Rhizopus arrhizus]KAG1445855.1 hypothetical protein G6F55_011786 [Rhizopus delemar]KAG1488679.1 hypothetical protein G6F54_011945 [Rhizopus delemar]KAG1497220.1 hypothetical protein G6F53_012019 [Rhizopus delemar]KAG1510687.1 hypothetical protein G6F52_010839 [Rhizopus delemar]